MVACVPRVRSYVGDPNVLPLEGLRYRVIMSENALPVGLQEFQSPDARPWHQLRGFSVKVVVGEHGHAENHS